MEKTMNKFYRSLISLIPITGVVMTMNEHMFFGSNKLELKDDWIIKNFSYVAYRDINYKNYLFVKNLRYQKLWCSDISDDGRIHLNGYYINDVLPMSQWYLRPVEITRRHISHSDQS